MSYNTARYLNFLAAVEALTPAQRETIDDANPLSANPFAMLKAEFASSVAKPHTRGKPRTDTTKGGGA